MYKKDTYLLTKREHFVHRKNKNKIENTTAHGAQLKTTTTTAETTTTKTKKTKTIRNTHKEGKKNRKIELSINIVIHRSQLKFISFSNILNRNRNRKKIYRKMNKRTKLQSVCYRIKNITIFI